MSTGGSLIGRRRVPRSTAVPTPVPVGLLVISQDAGRGRDQLLLLQLVRHLRASGTAVRLFLWEGGPLLGELRATGAEVQVVHELHEWRPGRLLQRLGRHREADRARGVRLRWRLARKRRTHPLVYVHGARAGRLLGYLGGDRVVVSHLHELSAPSDGALLDGLLAEHDATLVLERSDAFVVPEASVVEPVARAAGVGRGQVHVQRDYGDAALGRAPLALPVDPVLLVAVGTSDWWRAPDQVVPLFWQLRRRLPDQPLHLVWLCEDDDRDALWPLRHDLANAGLEQVVSVVRTAAPIDQLVFADVVVAVGRARDLEPVLADLQLAGRPVVVSDDGEAGERLGPQAVVVPYLDLDAAAGAIERLLREPPTTPSPAIATWAGADELVEALVELAHRGRRPPQRA